MRDYRKLRVFHRADALLLDVYKWSSRLPDDEKYRLRSQIRRSALSIPSNIVEGSARLGEGEYINFLNIALGSCAELTYLIDVAGRLYPSLAQKGHGLPASVVPRAASLKPQAAARAAGRKPASREAAS